VQTASAWPASHSGRTVLCADFDTPANSFEIANANSASIAACNAGAPTTTGTTTGVCVPLMACGNKCGAVPTGCGAFLQCGDCTASGSNAFCNSTFLCECQPQTCTQLGKTCGGPYNDGCNGQVANCGTCSGTSSCVNGNCVPANCTVSTSCQQQQQTCGNLKIGAGVSCPTVSCGTCQSPQICDGVNCGCDTSGTCPLEYECGTWFNGCAQQVCGQCRTSTELCRVKATGGTECFDPCGGFNCAGANTRCLGGACVCQLGYKPKFGSEDCESDGSIPTVASPATTALAPVVLMALAFVVAALL
jgi:hypothetical protein